MTAPILVARDVVSGYVPGLPIGTRGGFSEPYTFVQD